ncbi:hypothetical protein NDU88_001172 [Pleurodeles waltl]|uniref:Uncharacterized protein n=1 Tax=Pleurodeles waltl TaxID=8319 RepID=A0AAV7UVE5_PLEWA|nr:hypothetical protein NDU88_001172 [Pleurodeles waltl]
MGEEHRPSHPCWMDVRVALHHRGERCHTYIHAHTHVTCCVSPEGSQCSKGLRAEGGPFVLDYTTERLIREGLGGAFFSGRIHPHGPVAEENEESFRLGCVSLPSTECC